MAETKPLVGIIMGSKSDWDAMRQAAEMLARFEVAHEARVMSAHRTPAAVTYFASTARDKGYVAIIAAAGMTVDLAGVVAAHTTLPVVGVPISSGALNGVDALYSTVQMPKGIPVATVAIDGAVNAALLVVEMLATSAPAHQPMRSSNREKARFSCGRTEHLRNSGGDKAPYFLAAFRPCQATGKFASRTVIRVTRVQLALITP